MAFSINALFSGISLDSLFLLQARDFSHGELTLKHFDISEIRLSAVSYRFYESWHIYCEYK